MPIYGPVGVFYGGEVTKHPTEQCLVISGFLMRVPGGKMVGVGEANPARKIEIQFKDLPLDFNVRRDDDLSLPTYVLTVPRTQGRAFICYNPSLDVQEVVITTDKDSRYPVLAEVKWPDNAQTIAQLTIDYALRDVSLVAETMNPLRPTEYYSNGMDFADASFNRPLVSFGIMGEVLQGENRARMGSDYAQSTLRTSGMSFPEGADDVIRFEPFEVFVRERDEDGNDKYRHISTQRPFNLVIEGLALQGDTVLHIGIDRDHGTIEYRYGARVDNAVPLAYAIVPAGTTSVKDLTLIVVSDAPGNNLQTGTQVELSRLSHATGFVRPFVMRQHPTEARVLLTEDNLLVLNGVDVNVRQATKALPAPLANAARLDFYYLRVMRVLTPNVPQNGEFYVQLAGSGYAYMEPSIEVVENIEYGTPENILREALGYAPSTAGDGSFTKRNNESFGGTEWAVPLGFVSSFANASYATSRPWGGHGRPDGKTLASIHDDEIEVLAPVVRMDSSVSDAAILGKTVDAILRGRPTQLARNAVSNDPAYTTPYSKHPLQVDVINDEVVLGAHMLTPPNGLRRQWSAMPRPYHLGTSFPVKVLAAEAPEEIFDNDLVVYKQKARELIITLPDGCTLDLQGGADGMPEIDIRWENSGEPLIPESIEVSQGGRAVELALAQNQSGFPEASQIFRASVTVKVVGTRESYLKQTPYEMIGVLFNDSPVTMANEQVSELKLEHVAGTRAIRPVGGEDKFWGAAEVILYKAKVIDATPSLVVVPETIMVDGIERPVLGVRKVDMLKADGSVEEVMAIARQQRVGNTIEVTTHKDMHGGRDLLVHVALGGRVVNVRPDVNGVLEFANARMVQAQADGGAITRFVLDSSRVADDYGILLAGFGFIKDPIHKTFDHGVWVAGRLHKATIQDFGKNLVTIAVEITSTEFGSLSDAQKADWESLNGITYTLRQGVVFEVPLLVSEPPTRGDKVEIRYKHSSLGFMDAIHLGVGEMEIAHRGYVLASSDTISNQSDSHLSPVAERFPFTRGTMYSPDVMPVTTVRDAALSHEQNGILPLDGASFRISDPAEVRMGVYIMPTESGFAVWMTLVKVGRNLMVMAYVINSGALAVQDPTRALFCRPVVPYVA